MQKPELGDYIGVESCVEMKTDLDTDVAGRIMNNRRRESNRDTAVKIYPPPIPWLTRTGNLPSHMPWVMKKYYTSDGRLIIREEKVKRHEYFEAHRSNGRLVLNLIPFDGEVDDDDDEEIDEFDGNDKITEEDRMEENEGMVMEESDHCGGGTGCCSMGFAVAAPPFRSVHI